MVDVIGKAQTGRRIQGDPQAVIGFPALIGILGVINRVPQRPPEEKSSASKTLGAGPAKKASVPRKSTAFVALQACRDFKKDIVCRHPSSGNRAEACHRQGSGKIHNRKTSRLVLIRDQKPVSGGGTNNPRALIERNFFRLKNPAPLRNRAAESPLDRGAHMPGLMGQERRPRGRAVSSHPIPALFLPSRQIVKGKNGLVPANLNETVHPGHPAVIAEAGRRRQPAL
jgi:hypothetical protein